MQKRLLAINNLLLPKPFLPLSCDNTRGWILANHPLHAALLIDNGIPNPKVGQVLFSRTNRRALVLTQVVKIAIR